MTDTGKRHGLALWALAGALGCAAPEESTVATMEDGDPPVAAEEPVNAVLPACSSPAAATQGEWSAPFAWRNVAIHAILMPDGRVLTWSHYPDSTYLFDPKASDPRLAFVPAAQNLTTDLFCAGHNLLEDGRLFATGGQELHVYAGESEVNLYDGQANAWSPLPPMQTYRWYPTNTLLENGDVLVVSGLVYWEQEPTLEVELWSAATGWRTLNPSPFYMALYPFMYPTRDGRVYNAGPTDGTFYVDPRGSGSYEVGPASRVWRGYGASVLYDAGKIMNVGGGGPDVRAIAEVIDLDDPAPSWRQVASMTYGRIYHNATLLPDGTVLVTGGTSIDRDNASTVHAAEQWDPTTEEWTVLASNAIGRRYHSTALLLPDGRVLSMGGGGDNGYSPDELNAEIFTPPYLCRGGVRPAITAAPGTVHYGKSFSVKTPDAGRIARIVWIRPGATTHQFDQNQGVFFPSFHRKGNGLVVFPPARTPVVPPGHYMMFLVDRDGIPSVARIIGIR